jgi:hypothetical protein
MDDSITELVRLSDSDCIKILDFAEIFFIKLKLLNLLFFLSHTNCTEVAVQALLALLEALLAQLEALLM